MEISKLFNLKDKIVIVSGGGRGNGYQISKDLSTLGVKVCRLDKKFFNINSKNIFDYKLDITSEEKVKLVLQRIFKKFKKDRCNNNESCD